MRGTRGLSIPAAPLATDRDFARRNFRIRPVPGVIGEAEVPVNNAGACYSDPFIAGERPYGLQPLNYLSDPEYAGLAGLNPYYAAA